ncbi:MAG: hypothetical protein KME21_00160 [Desmonostoc vinosum HA7617-LM4]|nr:hypothetical protein [Desmonostoc vinosum HA7617-LM4]
MSVQIFASDLLLELSVEEQQLLSGGQWKDEKWKDDDKWKDDKKYRYYCDYCYKCYKRDY